MKIDCVDTVVSNLHQIRETFLGHPVCFLILSYDCHIIGGLHITSSFDYDYDYANYDQFAPNFDMAYKIIQCVSVPNLKLFGSIKTELRAKEVGEFFITLYEKLGWGHSLAHQHGCHNINVKRSSKF